MSKLFQVLANGPFELNEVSSYALEIHRQAKNINDIEFLITWFENDSFHIDCIKDGVLSTNCQFAWIGSSIAHEQFQSNRISLYERNPEKAVFEYTGDSFRKTVSECNDNSVGGIPITINYNFEYKCFEYLNMYNIFNGIRNQIVKTGEPIRFFTSAAVGGFSYEIEQIDIANLLLKIDQLEYHILYSRNFRGFPGGAENKHLFGLMIPMKTSFNDKNQLINIG